MAKQPGKSDGTWKLLAGMGAVLVLLVGGVLFYGLTRPPAPRGPWRTAIWVAHPLPGPGQRQDIILLVEEARGQGVRAVMLPARTDAGDFLPGPGQGRQAAAALAEALGLRVHQYMVIPGSLLAAVIDRGPGVSLRGETLRGDEALAYIFSPPEPRERMARLNEVLNQVAAQGFAGHLAISAREGLALARRIESSFGLLDLADRVSAWLVQGLPALEPAPGQAGPDGVWQLDRDALRAMFQPDPAPAG